MADSLGWGEVGKGKKVNFLNRNKLDRALRPNRSSCETTQDEGSSLWFSAAKWKKLPRPRVRHSASLSPFGDIHQERITWRSYNLPTYGYRVYYHDEL